MEERWMGWVGGGVGGITFFVLFCCFVNRIYISRSIHINRLQRMLFITTKHSMRIFGVGPFLNLQNNT